MKYQHLLSTAILGAATAVSASPLAVREDAGQCPVGYTMTTWVVTVTASPSTRSTPETTVSPTTSAAIISTTATPETETAVSATSPVVIVHSQLPIETASSTPDEAAVSVSSTPAATSEAPAPESTQTPAETTSSTESFAVVEIAPTSSSTSQEASTTETSASASTSTSTSSSISTASAQPVSTSSSLSSGTSGEATFYGGNVAGGTCSFSGYTLPSSLFGTALSVDMWDDASKCGACVAVTGPSGNTIKAMIVDQCPSCATNHFDLFQDAFSHLAALSTGVIDITWSYTSCNLDGPLKLKNKAGTSAYWFSMQVVNANEPVAVLEVSTDGGSTWQSTTRTYYNYFENEAGFGTDTVDVRVTGESGSSVVVKGVGCKSGVEVTADSNL